ncbi:MAG: cytochrome C [Acidobacteria bacterium]|nr:cytochrome C [Acidobacteriota bacterium]
MRLLLRLVVVLVVLAALAAAGGLAYLYARYPAVPAPPPTLTIDSTPERIERGRYLAEHVAVCVDCHSERDWSKFAGPIKPGTHGKGGETFSRETGDVPGTIFASNITPAAIGSWTDGELMHAVTTGVARDGRAMFPIMPYLNYGRAAADDIQAILAYVKTLPPVANPVPARSLELPMNFIVRTIPQPASFGSRPSPADRARYGEYVTRLAACGECHTPIDARGQPLAGMAFAGGMEFRSPATGYRVRSSNITPDADTGIGQWTEDQFINRFKGFEGQDDRVLSDEEQRQNTVMPWKPYAGMTRDDLGAIYTYLRTLKPVVNRVGRWPDTQAATR